MESGILNEEKYDGQQKDVTFPFWQARKTSAELKKFNEFILVPITEQDIIDILDHMITSHTGSL